MRNDALLRPQCKVMVLFVDAYVVFCNPLENSVMQMATEWLESLGIAIDDCEIEGVSISKVIRVGEML